MSRDDLIGRTEKVLRDRQQRKADEEQRRRRERLKEYVALLQRWNEPADGDETKLAELMEQLGFDFDQVRKHVTIVQEIREAEADAAQIDNIKQELEEAKKVHAEFEARVKDEAFDLKQRVCKAINRYDRVHHRVSSAKLLPNDAPELFEPDENGKPRLIG